MYVQIMLVTICFSILVSCLLTIMIAIISCRWCALCQHIQDGEAGAAAMEAARRHGEPRLTEDSVERSHDAHHGQPRNHRRRDRPEIHEMAPACPFV